jgi:hypothetical protein
MLVAGALASHATPPSLPDRRIVDTVHAGDPSSEVAHGYWGVDTDAGSADGARYREARGWMRYALTTFDDTEVTVSCTFAPSEAGDTRQFDLVVEDSVIASPELEPSATLRTVDILVPSRLTRGKTNIAITLRARGGTTPALRELRTIQDHNELDRLPSSLGAPR